jgi:hypothetical protein
MNLARLIMERGKDGQKLIFNSPCSSVTSVPPWLFLYIKLRRQILNL